MTYEIQFKPRAIKDLNRLPANVQKRVLEKIEALRTDLAGDVKRLTNFTTEYRLRIGDYRVLFEIENQTIIVYRILPRGAAYR